MRILITGGFGYLGGRLAKHFQAKGHQIILGTRHLVVAPPWLPEAKIVETIWDDNSSLEQSCRDVDVVIHAAGVNSSDCESDPIEALAFNGLATLKLVIAANKLKVKKFIYLSTAHVYSSPLAGSINEKTPPKNLHPYATSHIAGENAVLRSNMTGQMEGLVVRLSNVFGAPMNKDVNCWMLLVNELCKQGVVDRRMVLRDTKIQKRDFISMDEVCEDLEWLVMNKIDVYKENIFNISSEMSHTTIEIAQLVQTRFSKVLGFMPRLEHKMSFINNDISNLIIKADSLRAVGASKHICNKNVEIDNLINFCKSVFI